MLSIVFLHWCEDNRTKAVTIKSLESVFKYTTVPFQLILVSNGSDKDTNEAIEKVIKKQNNPNLVEINYAFSDTNVGVSKGFNLGLELVNGKANYISIFSNDWIVSPQWAELVIEELDNDPTCGFITCCTNVGAGSSSTDLNNPVRFTVPELELEDKHFWEKIESLAKHSSQARGVTTFNQFPAMGWTMKKEVFDKVGLMDERIYAANDVAYGKRAFNLGYVSKTAWAPFIYHYWHTSFSQINDRDTFSHIRPKEKADFNIINTDPMYKK